jgi:hypothetical protein
MLRVGPVGYTMEVGRMMEDIPKEGGTLSDDFSDVKMSVFGGNRSWAAVCYQWMICGYRNRRASVILSQCNHVASCRLAKGTNQLKLQLWGSVGIHR